MSDMTAAASRQQNNSVIESRDLGENLNLSSVEQFMAVRNGRMRPNQAGLEQDRVCYANI